MKRISLKPFVIATLITFLLAPFSQARLPEVKKDQPLPSNIFIELAKLVRPAVVNIYTSHTPRQRSHGRSPYNDPFFDLFEQFMNPGFNQPRRPMTALGTGFIIRKDGLIITNNHVIDKANSIRIRFSDSDKEYPATVVGKDSRTDVALIKIKVKKHLPTVRLGSSKKLEVGEWVAAFGNPFGHENTMTKGIVSALGRQINELNRFPFIQTDASINQGNSGGPLVNLQGEVVGVNTAIDARAQGIGFAIPIDKVKAILPVLEKKGSIQRGFLGVITQHISPQHAKMMGLKDNKGALIAKVIAKSSAQKAGLQPHDFIVSVNNNAVNSPSDLSRSIENLQIGTVVKIKILRNSKVRTLNAQLMPHPDDQRQQLKPIPKITKGQSTPYKHGFKVANYNRKLVKTFNLPKLRRPRPVVIEVNPKTSAAEAGLAPGDIVLDVNKKSVYSGKDLIKRLQRGTNVLRVLRQNQVLFIYLE